MNLDPDRTLLEGLHVYAAWQAGIEAHIMSEWTEKWAIMRAAVQPIITEALGWEIDIKHPGTETTIEVWLGDGQEDEIEDY